MTPQRKFVRNGVQHVYQISFNKVLIFCTVAEMILLFTLICVNARKYNVRITQLTIMFNHFHIQASFETKSDMENFMNSVTWAFAIIRNRHFGMKGQVFQRPYGNAPKKGRKVYDNSIYIANNPVVKNAVSSAWDYRWNFLRYAPELIVAGGEPDSYRLEYSPASRHPFSEEYIPLEASKEMQYLVKVVKKRASAGEYLGYNFFESSRYQSLSEKERLQLIDIIIVTYNVIDYSLVLQKYGSIKQFCSVLDNFEGNEYDVADDRETEDYRHYSRMIAMAGEEGYDMRTMRYSGVEGFQRRGKHFKKAHPVTLQPPNGNLMPYDLGEKLIEKFRMEIGATALEIGKLLNINYYEKKRNNERTDC